MRSPSAARPPWTRGEMLAAAIVVVGVAAVRLAYLQRAPAEWYGDISTVHESVTMIRAGGHSPGYFSVGLGDFYPALLVPFLAVLGDSYLGYKGAAAIIGFIGLALLGLFAARLLDRRLAIVTVAVAGTSSWWLIASRLADVQALTPTLTIAVVVTGHAAIRSADEITRPIACGILCALGVYTYGNTMVLPLIGSLLFLVAWRLGRATWRSSVAFGGAALVTLAPFLLETTKDSGPVLHGHVGQALVTGGDFLPNLARAITLTVGSYLTSGDKGFRANPMGVPHVDHISLVLALIGIVFWLGRRRRLTGLFLLGTFALLHLPAMLADADALPSASRTAAAAPLAYLFVGTGVWCIGSRMQRFGPAISTAAMAWTLIVLAVVNVHVYAAVYLPGLPVRNVPVGGMLVDLVDAQPPGSTVHMVSEGWLEWAVPEYKTVAYQADHPDRLVRHVDLTCADVQAIARPAVLVWRPDADLPGTVGADCPVLPTDVEVIRTPGGRDIYRVGRLP